MDSRTLTRMPAAASAPTRLDIRAFAQAAQERSGADVLAAYPRLAEEAQRDAGQSLVRWRALGAMRPDALGVAQPWLHLQAQAMLPLSCQRCLDVVEVPLEVDRHFRFVADEATAEAEDDDAEEDLLVASDAFDLQALIEDELILAMPLIAMHDVCPSPSPPLGAGDDAKLPERPNPFAVLQQLRKPPGSRQ